MGLSLLEDFDGIVLNDAVDFVIAFDLEFWLYLFHMIVKFKNSVKTAQ